MQVLSYLQTLRCCGSLPSMIMKNIIVIFPQWSPMTICCATTVTLIMCWMILKPLETQTNPRTQEVRKIKLKAWKIRKEWVRCKKLYGNYNPWPLTYIPMGFSWLTLGPYDICFLMFTWGRLKLQKYSSIG